MADFKDIETIGELIRQPDKKKIVVAIKEYNGHLYTDIRTMIYNESSGSWSFTKQGITLGKAQAQEMIALLETADSFYTGYQPPEEEQAPEQTTDVEPF